MFVIIFVNIPLFTPFTWLIELTTHEFQPKSTCLTNHTHKHTQAFTLLHGCKHTEVNTSSLVEEVSIFLSLVIVALFGSDLHTTVL